MNEELFLTFFLKWIKCSTFDLLIIFIISHFTGYIKRLWRAVKEAKFFENWPDMLTMDAVCDTATGTTGLEISANINFRIIFLGSKLKKINKWRGSENDKK